MYVGDGFWGFVLQRHGFIAFEVFCWSLRECEVDVRDY